MHFGILQNTVVIDFYTPIGWVTLSVVTTHHKTGLSTSVSLFELSLLKDTDSSLSLKLIVAQISISPLTPLQELWSALPILPFPRFLFPLYWLKILFCFDAFC